MTAVRLFILSLLFSVASAHSGYNSLQWESQWGAYTATVLEDFHVSKREQRGQLFVQLSAGNSPAPEDTTVSAKLSLNNEPVYEGKVPYLTNGNTAGRFSYRAYFLDIPLDTAGSYHLELTTTGSLGDASATYVVTTQGGKSALEYLPSGLILFIAVGGLAVLFVPIKHQQQAEKGNA